MKLGITHIKSYYSIRSPATFNHFTNLTKSWTLVMHPPLAVANKVGVRRLDSKIVHHDRTLTKTALRKGFSSVALFTSPTMIFNWTRRI